MKISLIILLLAMIFAGITGIIIVNNIILWFRKRNLTKSSIEISEIDGSTVKETNFAWLMRNGITFLKKPCNLLIHKFRYVDNLFSNIVNLLEDKNIFSDKVSVASVFIAFCVFIAIVVSLILNSVIAGLAIVLFIFICLVTSIKAALDKKSNELRNSIPEALRSMSSCFGAGYTLYQTFAQISEESDGSIHKLFSKSSHVLQTGGSVSQSLQNLKDAKEAPELAFVAVALDVQHQTGGSMKPVIESAKDMVDSKLELLRLLQVQTAQAKLSARIVMIMPFALVAIFSMLSPGFLSPFFSSFLGVLILSVAVIMQAAGIILVRKLLYVEV